MTQSSLPRIVLLSLSAALFAACGDSAAEVDMGGGGDTGGIRDVVDGVDLGPPDAGRVDQGTPDQGTPDTGETPDAGQDAGVVDTGGTPLLPGPTKGGPIAVNPAGTILAVADKGSGTVRTFDLPTMAVRGTIVAAGSEPTSVSWSASGDRLYVVQRADAEVQVLNGADTANLTNGSVIAVGSEPSLGALSPTGARLFVTNWVDGTLSVINTANNTVDRTVALGGNPHGVCVTNDGDTEDSDETIYVTDFYSRPVAGQREATDAARFGRVFRINAGTFAVSTSSISPLTNVGIAAVAGTGAFPNQLYSCIVNRGFVYITNVGASPASFNNGTDFRQNIQGLVSVLDATTNLEVTARTVNLNALVDAQIAPKRFASVPVDIAFAPNSDFGYVASTLSNNAFRIDWTASPPTGGAGAGLNFLATGSSPSGIAINGSTAYVYNEVTRNVTSINLASQMPIADHVVADLPSAPLEQSELRGQRFFNTGNGRWSANGWVGCVGCHPFGTTDNVTWSFPAGPRQTVDTSATFNDDGSVQRILNWTAIFDEAHDFELNTRGVANGTGAIVNSTVLNADGTPNTAARIDLAIGPNNFNFGSAAEVATTSSTPEDWNDIENYMKTIRAPRGKTAVPADVAAGRTVFTNAGCQNCHGGELWTLSERYYTPASSNGNSFSTLSLFSAGVVNLGLVRVGQVRVTDTNLLTVLETDAGAPARHTCVVRIVGTFDSDGPSLRGAAEVRQNGPAAQGALGFNVPSLLNLATGAPYLHNGAAETLEELLDPAGDFVTHLQAGNLVFAPTAQEQANLIAFLKSIDDTSTTIAVPTTQRFCPSSL